MPARDFGPRVFVPPPLVFVGGWIVAWLLDWRIEFAIDGAGPSIPQVGLGVALLLAGFGLMAWAMLTFRRCQTPVVPVQPARVVVDEGPYRFTRNPMYLGLTGAYVGFAALTNQAWPLVLLPAILFIMSAAIIEREERHLGARFGASYEEYCSRVRRWI